VKRIGARAGFKTSAKNGGGFSVHAHMLRHACGYALANAGHDTRRIQDWLGHRSIQHTTRHTQLSAAPFKDFWRAASRRRREADLKIPRQMPPFAAVADQAPSENDLTDYDL
jgi:integrase